MSKDKQILTRKHLARQERDRIQTRYVMVAAIAIIVLIVGLIGYGILNEKVLIPNRPVATINGEKISLKEFQVQARYTRQNIINQYMQTYQFAQMFGSDQTYTDYFNQQLVQIAYQLDPTLVGQAVIDGLIEDRIIRAEAKKLGITVTNEEVDKALQDAFGYYPGGTPTVAPTYPALPTSTLSPTQLALVPPEPTQVITQTATPTSIPPTATPAEPTVTPTPYTEEAFKTNFDKTVSGLDTSIQVSENDLRRIYESILYRQKVYEVKTVDAPHTSEQVWARHILVADEATAKQVLARLQAGEDFTALAKELSTDTGSASVGGDLGWFGKGKMDAAFETSAFNMSIGQISEPVKSSFGWHIIQVLGHENRPLDEQAYTDLRKANFQTWLDEQRKTDDVQINESWVSNVPVEPTIPPEYSVTTQN